MKTERVLRADATGVERTPALPAGELQVAVSRSGADAWLTVVGSVDCFTEAVLVDALEQVADRGAEHLVVDLHDVDFFGAAGYWALARARARQVASGGSLRVVGAGPATAGVAERIGLDIGISA